MPDYRVKKNKIIFVYAAGKFFSGQRYGSEVLMRQMTAAGYECIPLTSPSLDGRNVLSPSYWIEYFLFVVKLFWNWRLGDFYLHVNLGQSRAGFWREGLALRLSRFKKKGKVFVSLHGNVFMNWERSNFIGKAFSRVLQSADIVCVSGRRQKRSLVRFYPHSDQIINMPNSCEYAPMSLEMLDEKYRAKEPIHILYLSSLIDTKGYPELLEAVNLLPEGQDLKVTICGKFTASPYNQRFSSLEEARNWTIGKIKEIEEEKPFIKINLLENGAFGEEKLNLFQSAHLFVLPTYYPVEAQPFAIIEAMANGCAIISCDTGEVAEMLEPPVYGLFAQEKNPKDLALKLETMIKDIPLLKKLSNQSLNRYIQQYEFSSVANRWISLLD